MGIQINGQNDTITAIDGSITVGTDLTVPGVLSYEDVTSVDSIGLVTARSGIHVTGGSVGIGTDNPVTPLHVSGKILSVTSGTPTGTYNYQYNAHVNSGDAGLQITSGTNYSYFLGDSNNIILASDQGSTGHKVTVNRNCPDSSLVVDSSGRLGIGIASPLSPIHVNGTSQPTAVIGPSFSSAHGNSVGAARSVFVYIDREPSSLTWSDTVNRDRFFSNSLYVRTPVRDSINNPAIVIAENGGQATGRNSLVFWNDDFSGISGYIKARLYTQVGSSYNATAFFIDVADSSRNIQNRFSIDVNGNFAGSSSANISDARLKENIQTIQNPIDKIKGLTGRTFTWTDASTRNDGRTHYGFIAQEVDTVVSELVRHNSGLTWFDANDNIVDEFDENVANSSKTVHEQGVIPILVEALKEALEKIETLEIEVESLKAAQ